MNDVIIRRAKQADLPRIVAMLADDGIGKSREDTSTPLNAKYVEAFEALERDPNQLLVVMEQGGAVVGSLQISFIPGLSRVGAWRGQIEGVRIASDVRGQGLGHRLIEWAIAECRKRGCELVQFTSDKRRHDAIRFYESIGFRATHQGMKLNL